MLLKFSNVKCSFSQLAYEHLLVAVSRLMILVKEPNFSKSHTIYLGHTHFLTVSVQMDK